MEELISPKYQIELMKNVEEKIWEHFKSYKTVLAYIKKWHQSEDGYNFNNWENFNIVLYNNGNIDLQSTLASMNGSDLLKVAIDMGVDTPDFIPSIPTFKNAIKEEYENVYETFIKAIKNIESDPSLAIGLANSAFESLIKEIIKDDRISVKLSGNETLFKLVQIILKEFKISDQNFPIEIKTINTSLIAISQSIEKMRSEKTIFHGKVKEDLLIEDSMYVYLTINAFTSVGLFLNSFYKKKFPKIEVEDDRNNDYDDLPF
ncbi:abortive infection family protein [Epilithonimonas sp. JDS]|uniref:abortive infection family protein n=1 Tax=Epilithonimonas sp. JDS TaxID=2902797 RepID=UPI001E4D4144|nr:abortive infection family protein [Epilithonimonas sp. JDS]MCD9855894.1 abortive infection family protein [Epilithonimonas sp. JDS]